jgi:uncharacterized membrane protein (UPF0127 family)
MKRTVGLALSVVGLLAVAACSQPMQKPSSDAGAKPPPSPIPMPQAILPDDLMIDLELALTAEEISNGLMFRPSLPGDRGMLFLFDAPRLPSFWMKNMLIPLDLIFLDEGGTVVDVVADAPPCADDPCPTYPPSEPAMAVLEMVAGSAAAHGLEPGAIIRFERVPGYPAVP